MKKASQFTVRLRKYLAVLITIPILAGCGAHAPVAAIIAPMLATQVLAGAVVYQLLTEKDRQRAEAAARLAVEQREAAAQRALYARILQTERALRLELARAQNEVHRARAYQRAAETQLATLRDSVARSPGPMVQWSGTASGSAQALGPAPVQAAGMTRCERVRELVIAQGREARQESTFCIDPRTGGRVRVS